MRFSNCEVAAIIFPRPRRQAQFSLIGRVIVARRTGEKRKAVSESSPELFKYSVPDSSSLLAVNMIRF